MTLKTLPEHKTAQIDAICALAPVIPVLTFDSAAEALPIAEALVEGGLPVLEVTLRTEAALDAIQLLADKLPEARVGAGTIANPAQYKAACEAGARFIVTPGSTRELLDTGIDSDIPLLPGIQTISEMMEGLQRGYRRFKFFPASIAGGPGALKAYAGPFPDVRFCPTGGIRLESADDYLSLDNVMCVGGSWLTPADLIARQDWNAIRDLARMTVDRLSA
ncbi:2-dehydro-3-deoxy-phosphogluconate aldolase [Marinobacterium nitratireducens]|uniref:2-dehydro-3-deoxy-phosphogluconate aldolase n=1 Tax=Marinobacterium nitratireducens TaxID=518897 RepID=A0A917ZND2_9GAMM|nr:bifunctional 4-hydroxy-2-oxoglutarate aldolase/2-dehydro-3-deoxy-phosphogluconate aldolase [Marinobacterium nitratireducens]GGO85690.1 2-dehydro-3-deoxy-phosphogluconate aldolase [Marinobacterium nitratireducens]